jgi:hypothetical protein
VQKSNFITFLYGYETWYLRLNKENRQVVTFEIFTAVEVEFVKMR